MNYPLGSSVSYVPRLTLGYDVSPRSLNFVKAIQFTLPWETGREKDGGLRKDGGLHFRDGGVATKYGIYKGANPDIDVENLSVDDAIEIYKDRYWLVYLHQKPVYFNLDAGEIGLTTSLFDAGVNCGVPRAWKWFLQTQNENDPAKVINMLRGAYYADLKARDPAKFGVNFSGWMNRLNDLKKSVDVLRLTHGSDGQLPVWLTQRPSS